MNRIGKLDDGRLVMLKRVNYNLAEVSIGDKLVGYVKTQSQPQRDAVTTQFVNTLYGEAVARSVGFGNHDVFTAHELNNRKINAREFDRIEQAAMLVAKHAAFNLKD